MIEHILLAAEVVSALSVFVGVLVYICKRAKKNETALEGTRCLLRRGMVETYYKHKDTEHIRQYEIENFIKEYEAYKALGGNSFIDEIHKEVITWEVET